MAIAMALAWVVAQAGAADTGPAQPMPKEPSAMAAAVDDAAQEQELFLEVFFGQRSTGLIASVRLKEGRL
ncbi:MAG: hypothetical protein L0H23_08205, partial [Luteimonas sp.]|nr:hypothetical protein [Luteimonas sp.]